MALGNRNIPTAVNDGGSGGSKYSQLAEYARQQSEAKWAAQMEEQRKREEKEERERQKQAAAQKAQAKQRIAEQRAADQAAAQQDAANDAWKNIVDYSNPSNLSSNGQKIWNNQTGQIYTVPNYSQQKNTQQTPQSAAPYQSNFREDIANVVEPSAVSGNSFENIVEPVQEQPQRQTPQVQGYVTPVTQGLNQQQVDTINAVTGTFSKPRVYDPNEIIQDLKQNGIPVDQATNMNDLYEIWRTYMANQNAAEQANDQWATVVDNTSALGGGYVQPVTPQLASEGIPSTTPVLPGAQAVRNSQEIAQTVSGALRDFAAGVTRPGTTPVENTLPDLPLTTPVLSTTDAIRNGVENSMNAYDQEMAGRKIMARDRISAQRAADEAAALQDASTQWVRRVTPNLASEGAPSMAYIVEQQPATRDAVTADPAYQDRYDRAIEALNRQGIYGDEADRQAREMASDITTLIQDVKEWATPEYDETPEEKAERLAQMTNDLIANGGINNIVESESNADKRDRLDAMTQQLIDSGAINDMPAAENDQGLWDRLTNAWNGGGSKEGTKPASAESTTPSTTTNKGTNTPASSSSEADATQLAYEAYLLATGKRVEDLDDNDFWQIRLAAQELKDKWGKGQPATASEAVTAAQDRKPKPQYFTPSYGQDMEKGVKLPYKQGGYTEADLKSAGNKPYKDAYGNTQYEGYYQWNGVWYPVDQQKAEYYMRYGTYNGWDEGMRDYFNTFGTFYGYTPTWRTTGRNTGGGGYRNYSWSSRGGGGGGGGGYYGSSQVSGKNQEDQRVNNIMKNLAI